MESIESFILAGGASRRMGTNKSQLLLDGQTLVQRIADVLLKVASKVTIVGREKADPQFSFVQDVYPEWGALGGVHAALSACNTDWAFVVACDMPFISEALVLRLASFRGDFEAVAPVQPDGRPQPLCSLYRVTPCQAIAEKLIQSGERKPVTLLQSVRTRWVDFAELADLPDAASFFVNMNTPEDYARALEKGQE
ncbi:MAG: molybdenum cofactor guanylyltransferase [Acidobacteriota bacterium]|nr:molybdenum cofactor guanylyltransferase [Acidobacteriota bacterium]